MRFKNSVSGGSNFDLRGVGGIWWRLGWVGYMMGVLVGQFNRFAYLVYVRLFQHNIQQRHRLTWKKHALFAPWPDAEHVHDYFKDTLKK
jgi:hypothetical protein